MTMAGPNIGCLNVVIRDVQAQALYLLGHLIDGVLNLRHALDGHGHAASGTKS